jgi:hypothetical protein
MKIVYIEWIDSKSGPSGWEHMDEIEPVEPQVCNTVGFLIDDKESFKTIAPTVGGGQVLGRITIPQCSIVKLRELQV